MRILLTGSRGQLGQALRASLPAKLAGEPVDLITTARKPEPAQNVVGLDLADPEACHAAVMAHKPDWVLNAGAYTAVDRAESELELAQAVNAGAPRAFAEALAHSSDRSRLLQISTDFVFSGEQSHPYRPEDPRNPVSAYGTSKAAGEQAVADALGTADHAGTQRPRHDPAHQLGVWAGGPQFPAHDAAAASPESHYGRAPARGGRSGGLPHQHGRTGARMLGRDRAPCERHPALERCRCGQLV